MGKDKNLGEVRELFPQEEEDISYRMHGHWVRHREYGHVGNIAYYDKVKKLVAVVWLPATKRESSRPMKTTSSGLHTYSELLLLTKYDPEPWYNFEEIKRRKKALDGE